VHAVNILVLRQQLINDFRRSSSGDHNKFVLSVLDREQLTDELLDLLSVFEFKQVDVFDQTEEGLVVDNARSDQMLRSNLNKGISSDFFRATY